MRRLASFTFTQSTLVRFSIALVRAGHDSAVQNVLIASSADFLTIQAVSNILTFEHILIERYIAFK